MNYELSGNKVKFTKTIAPEIDNIMTFERINAAFVHGYTKARHLELLGTSDCLHLSIRRIDNDHLIGHMIVFGLDSNHDSLEFRRITISEKGQGYGRDAIRLLKRLCFEQLKFHRLWFDVFDDNTRAIGLYESEGFVKEGVLRECIKTHDGFRSLRVYSMLKNEYTEHA
ncbi:GNAT family protein [Fulvivirgaceae bacterium BMA10]|uniref:GNAT family protein n=1 Tax=Splendidivirga corallicola TaxID=3051826 RepID=A0ABT8KIZ5_9BACT|nr:GNAT family protein [Fulvivirgaceae bacterium BMA10]